MGSYCDLIFDDTKVVDYKYHVPDDWSAIFQESDRIEIPEEKGRKKFIGYRASRKSILKRLDLMGCTAERAKIFYSRWHNRKLQTLRSSIFDAGKKPRQDELYVVFERLFWEDWRQRVPIALRDPFGRDYSIDVAIRMMRRWNDGWLWFDGINSLVSLRAVIDAAENVRTVSLGIDDLIDSNPKMGGKICTKKCRTISVRGLPCGPTIILVKGKPDIAIFKESLRRFHPDLEDFVTFLDHSDLHAAPSASYVVKFLNTLATAHVPANIVAVFDNDAVGRFAYDQAQSLKLPSNIACIRLPDIELGRSYPTIGPEGRTNVDINGRACGIEMYLGREALTVNGALRAVRWSDYVEGCRCIPRRD